MNCPVAGCSTGISPGHTVCKPHYKRIPCHLRHVLAEAFRDRLTDPARYARAVAATRELAQTYSTREIPCSAS